MKLTKEYIQETYPEMFKTCFDFSIGNGWLPMILVFCKQHPDAKIIQIKEKFGSLRFYIEGSEEAHFFIVPMELLSELVCEGCGRPAKSKSINGWIKTLCQECQYSYMKQSLRNNAS